MKKRGFKITIKVVPDGDGYYAYCPGLPGVFAGGETEEEAVCEARIGAISILRTMIDRGEEIITNDDLRPIDPSHIVPRPKRYKKDITIDAMAMAFA